MGACCIAQRIVTDVIVSYGLWQPGYYVVNYEPVGEVTELSTSETQHWLSGRPPRTKEGRGTHWAVLVVHL